MTVISSFFSDKLLSESLRSSSLSLNIKPLTYVLLWNSFPSSPASSWVPLSFCWTFLVVTLTIYLWQFLPDSIIRQNFELGGFSIGYVIATSEPADSQVSSFSPARTISLSSYDKILSLVASQSVLLLRPLNRQIAKSHLSVRQGLFLCILWQNLELGGFLIGYVIATSEPADSQVSSFSPVRTIFSNGCNTTWKREFRR